MKALATALRTQATMRSERTARRTKPAAWPKPRYPHREELVYYRRLRYLVELVQHIVRRDIVPVLPGLLDEVGPTRRTDSADDIDRAFAAAAAAAAKDLPEATIEAAAQSTALRVTEWSADQFQRQVERVVKVNLYDDSSGLAPHLELFVSDNVKLIKSVAYGQLEDLKGVVTRGARAGLHHTEVQRQIQEQFGVTKRRAALIATDQVGKLNGELNALRQQNLGVRRYRWSTSLDERVRRSHRSLEGSIQEWARPPVVDPRTGERGHPGQPIRCRCSAIPIIDDVLADAGLIDPGDVELTHPRTGDQPPLRTPPAIVPRPSSRPPPAPTPPRPPPIPPPPVPQRTDPPLDPAALLGRTVPSAARAAAIEAERAAEVAAAARAAQHQAAEAARAAEAEALEVWRAAQPGRRKRRRRRPAGALPPKRKRPPTRTDAAGQPRVPAGSPAGGQFASSRGGGGGGRGGPWADEAAQRMALATTHGELHLAAHVGPAERTAFFVSQGHTPEAVKAADDLLVSYGGNRSQQEHAMKAIDEHLAAGDDVARALHAASDLEQHAVGIWKSGSAARTQQLEQKIASAERAWEDKYERGRMEQEHGADDFAGVAADMRRQHARAEVAMQTVYRGGTTGQRTVESWTIHAGGATTQHLGSGAGSRIKVDHRATYDELNARGYYLLGGVVRMMGAPGEGERTFIRRRRKPP